MSPRSRSRGTLRSDTSVGCLHAAAPSLQAVDWRTRRRAALLLALSPLLITCANCLISPGAAVRLSRSQHSAVNINVNRRTADASTARTAPPTAAAERAGTRQNLNLASSPAAVQSSRLPIRKGGSSVSIGNLGGNTPPVRTLLAGGGGGGDRGGSGRGGRGGGGDGDHGGEWDARHDGQPALSLAAASSLADSMKRLQDVLRSVRLPWNRNKGVEDTETPEAGSRQKIEEDLAKVLVADVVVESSIIPREVLASAVVKTDLLGREASAERIKACADTLNNWYKYEGYLLSSVSNAVISPNGTIAFTVFEPVVSRKAPVQLTYYKPANASDPSSELVRVDKGKTRASTVAKGLGLKGGEHFRVDAKRWRGILTSGLFSGAQLSGAHQAPGDEGATLDVNVEERRTMVFEPGVTKTLFDSNWAGEASVGISEIILYVMICFEERNTLGTNSVLGLDIRRSMSSPFTSFSIRLGNSRFGRPGGWQVSLYRDIIAPRSGFGGGTDSYANSAIGTASSAPVFSTASPDGTPRDLGILARSLRGTHRERVDSARNVTLEGAGGSPGRTALSKSADSGLSRCRGVSLSTSWPFSVVRATLGAGFQQVSMPSGVLEGRSFEKGSRGPSADADGGDVDVVTLSGGLSKDWPLPSVLRRLSGSSNRRDVAGVGGGAGGRRRNAGSAGGSEGSVSTFLDMKTGCMLQGGATPQPFTQELATVMQRVPLGPSGQAGSWNVTLNIKQQVQHCSEDTPMHQVPPFGGQRTIRGFLEGELGRAKQYALATAEVRVPLRDMFGKLSMQVVVFADVGAFRPVTWSRAVASSSARRGYGWDTARGPYGGGVEGRVPTGGSEGNAGNAAVFQDDVGERSGDESMGGSGDVSGEGGGEPAMDLDRGHAGVIDPAVASPGATEADARRALQGQWHSVGANGGFRVRGGQGIGLRIGDLIQVDLGLTRSGMKQIHIGLVDRNF